MKKIVLVLSTVSSLSAMDSKEAPPAYEIAPRSATACDEELKVCVKERDEILDILGSALYPMRDVELTNAIGVFVKATQEKKNLAFMRAAQITLSGRIREIPDISLINALRSFVTHVKVGLVEDTHLDILENVGLKLLIQSDQGIDTVSSPIKRTLAVEKIQTLDSWYKNALEATIKAADDASSTNKETTIKKKENDINRFTRKQIERFNAICKSCPTFISGAISELEKGAHEKDESCLETLVTLYQSGNFAKKDLIKSEKYQAILESLD